MEQKRKEQILRMSGAEVRKCMKCGKCSATCPSYDEMEYHPHQFVAMVNEGNIEKLMESESIYKCLTCFACVERCPRGVEPAKVVEAVRLEVIRQQGKNRLKQDDIPAKLDEDTPGQLLMTAMRKYAK
ncbi:MAG: 4Fe-4S dicluster domain-containing protein [Ruminococcaceae bacterium]|nr:4Fe-4S dicluster domain-containing protein [Oscillospiraceae bacterium]